MATFKLEVISPISKFLSTEADYMKIRTINGDMGILADHAPFVSVLVPTQMMVRKGKEEKKYYISGGFIEISDDTVTILADEALKIEQIKMDQVISEQEEVTEKIKMLEKEDINKLDEIKQKEHEKQLGKNRILLAQLNVKKELITPKNQE